MTSSTAAQAVQSLNNGVPPEYTILLRNLFRVLVSRKDVTTAQQADYYAVDFNGLLRFQSTPYPPDAIMRSSFLIPVTPGRSVFTAGHFPTGSFSTINLVPNVLRAICTEQLTGCTMAFGWDSTNRRLHVGHVEPDDTIPQISTRANLSNYLRTNAAFTGFQGIALNRANILFVGGARRVWSDYAGDKANVIGFLHGNAIKLIVQVEMPTRQIRESWTMDFPM